MAASLIHVLPALQVVVKNYCSGYGIDDSLVASVHFLHAPVNHGTVSYGRSKAFVKHLDGDIGQFFLQPLEKWGKVLNALARLSVQLLGLPYHNQLHRLRCNILFQEINHLSRRNRGQTVCHDFKRIGNSYARALPSEVYR